jgi:glycosyltransferase involved in cell wall biosynthesis
VASGLVRRQLLAEGVRADRIWVTPYGADPGRFHPPAAGTARARRVLFAGQLTLRKGLRTLFDGFLAADAPGDVHLDCFGPVAPDAHPVLARISGESRIHLHGAISQRQLADEMRSAALLVLPSLEEGFGLVVPQALNCGTPCVVSDRVGAMDLIRHRGNGSVFAAGDAAALAAEIAWWLQNPGAFTDTVHSWDEPAELLLRLTRAGVGQ